MSGTYLLFRKQSTHTTPLYKYVFCSLSNIMSSWCQYEALKYVSFPMQVSHAKDFLNAAFYMPPVFVLLNEQY